MRIITLNVGEVGIGCCWGATEGETNSHYLHVGVNLESALEMDLPFQACLIINQYSMMTKDL